MNTNSLPFKSLLLKVLVLACVGVLSKYVTSQTHSDTVVLNGISKKVIRITKTQKPPKIDGKDTDDLWLSAPVASDFTERRPTNGQAVPKAFKTEVQIAYDDEAVYFLAKMFDPEPDKIAKEITERDDIGNDDFIFIMLNGYNDGQQSQQFIVTAAGVQYDARSTNDGEDNSWNGVWYSKVQITDFGWVAELKIPFRELRFPEKPIQEWGLQIERELRRKRQRFSWNFVDNTQGSFMQYDGVMRGVEDIKTPVRLSFLPYLSSYYNNTDGETDIQLNGGMDIKYGINDAFTLDMTLIPDFGQAGFDDVVLNLGPFEQVFQEQRQFFTEGTELFGKGDLFYSRRIGGRPTGSLNLKESETAINTPNRVNLLNAVKISGRTNNGLGVGVFNAITEKTFATVQDTITATARDVLVEPFANYNVLVLDQRFGNNSSVSLVNTNTFREGSFRDANVTGLYTSINNKANTYRFFGHLEGSWVMDNGTNFGQEARLGFTKIQGEHRFQYSSFMRTQEYDINDLGFTGTRNYHEHQGWYGYQYLQPKGFLNNLNLNFNLRHRRRLEPDLFTDLIFNFNSSFNTRNFFSFGTGLETNLVGQKDIFEPRTRGKHLNLPSYYNIWGWISTDYRKKYAVDLELDWQNWDGPGRYDASIEVRNRYRFSDQWTFRWNTEWIINGDQQGFADRVDENVIIGTRDRKTLSNSISSQFSFNENAILNLAFRHYYSVVEYEDYNRLKDNGDVESFAYNDDQNGTFNSWNIDLRFSWWFAPGSQLSVLYRNAISDFENQPVKNTQENFNNLFEAPITNNFSVRVVYFLDYNWVKKWFDQKV